MTSMRRLRSVALAAALTLAAGALTGGVARAGHDAASPAQAEFEEGIRDYLLKHPGLILEVIQIMQEREQTAKAERARANFAANRDALFNDPAAPTAGNANGDVTLVEFFDYQCGYCKRVLKDVLAVLDEDPGLRVVYKEFPILGPVSIVAARAALAANAQDPGRYQEFHVALMSRRGRLTEAGILQTAREIGYDVERLKADMDSPEIAKTIQENLELARALGINGTPAFAIGDQIVPGAVSLEKLRELIAQARTG